MARLHGVSQYPKCSEYRNYPLCFYELKAIVADDNPNSMAMMFKNTHNHENHNETSRLPSLVKQPVSKYVTAGLSQPQIHSIIAIKYPSVPISPVKLTSLVQANRRKNHPTIFSIYDFRT